MHDSAGTAKAQTPAVAAVLEFPQLLAAVGGNVVEDFAAGRAERDFVIKSGFDSDPPCRPKRRGGRWRDILHAPIRVEGGKMKRYIGTQPFPDPSAQGLNLGC